jgi:hypothetical protein
MGRIHEGKQFSEAHTAHLHALTDWEAFCRL